MAAPGCRAGRDGHRRRPQAIEDMDVYKASLRVRIQKAQGRANALIESYK